MNKFKQLLVFSATVGLLAACNGGNEAAPSAPAASAPAAQAASHEHHAHDGHAHHTLSGTYHGSFPCADCSELAVTLVLKDDMSYDLNLDYQGGKRELKEQESGKFSWEEDGKILKLDGKDNPMRLVVAEDGQLQQLADDAKAYDAEKVRYNLKKQ